ncbi:MAG: hypothetical protein QM765_30410 [Myxococcales bacterium]
MRDLSPESRALLDASRSAQEPTASDKSRILSGLQHRLALAPLAPLSAAGAKAAASANAAAGLSFVKVALFIGAAAAVTTGSVVYVATQPAPISAPVAWPAATPSAPATPETAPAVALEPPVPAAPPPEMAPVRIEPGAASRCHPGAARRRSRTRGRARARCDGARSRARASACAICRPA